MPNNYTFFDSDASVLTAESSIISGSIHRPIVTIASFLSAVPTTASGNQSVSGTVNIGNAPSVYGNISGSVASFNQAGTAVLGSIAVLQGTNPWNISSIYGNISGSVLSQQLGTRISSVINDAPSSLLTGASIFGQLPAGTAVLGSVAVLQGTPIWNISSVYGNVSGSVLSQQLGTRISSIVGSIPSSTLVGIYGHRNDAVASFLGGNLSWNPLATDSAGRILARPFAAEESRIEGYASTVNLNANSIIAAAGTGLRNYITDVWVANTGAAATLVTFLSGGGLSVLGYTIAPSGSGSNLPGLVTPMRTDANATFDFRAATGTSVLYITAKGFKAP